MKDIKLVVLDMAGTTVADNNFVRRALISVLKNYGTEVSTEEVNSCMGIPKPVAIRQLLELKNKNVLKISEAWVSEIHKRFVLEMVGFYATSSEVKEKPGVRETFIALRKADIKIAIDTGFDRKIAQTIIDRLGWEKDRLIDFSVTSDEVENGRPFPDMIYKAMEMAGIEDAAQVAKAGDTASDIQQGRSAGCSLVVGITTGAFSEKELAAENPTHLIESLPELLSILQPASVS